MEDLVSTFGGLSPPDFCPPTTRLSLPEPAQQPVTSTAAKPESSHMKAASTGPSIKTTTANCGSYPDPHIMPSLPSASAKSPAGTRPPFHDLTKLRELFSQQTMLPITPPTSSDGVTVANKSSTAPEEDSELEYIHHFKPINPIGHKSAATPSPATPAPPPSSPAPPAPPTRRNLLRDLSIATTESPSTVQRGSDSTNDFPRLRRVDTSRADHDNEASGSGDISVTGDNNSAMELHYNNLELQEHYERLQEQQADETDNTPDTNGMNDIDQAYLRNRRSSSSSTTNSNRRNDLAHLLRRFHKQDMKRDRLLNDLVQENHTLSQALKAEARRSRDLLSMQDLQAKNPRAEAAERGLMEARRDIQKRPFAYVLIDGEGYDFYPDLLQSGRIGGVEAAKRLVTEIQNYLPDTMDVESYDIMVHIYLNVSGVLLRYIDHGAFSSDNFFTSEQNVRAFVRGFAQAREGPLVDIVDVGEDQEIAYRKIQGRLELFANNVHCKRIFLGCCHDSAYASLLEPYRGNPIIAPRITLLGSGESHPVFKSLPYDMIDLPQTFTPSPYSTKATFASRDVSLWQADHFSRSSKEVPSTNVEGSSTPSEGLPPSLNTTISSSEAIAKWQEAANKDTEVSSFRRPHSRFLQTSGQSSGKVLLNIDDERVDPPLQKEDPETRRHMLVQMKEQNYCAFFHLLDACQPERSGRPCKYRHEPKLNNEELAVLRNKARGLPCGVGSICRNSLCPFGHSCSNQPGCTFGAKCRLAKFHKVDNTAVKVWRPSKTQQ